MNLAKSFLLVSLIAFLVVGSLGIAGMGMSMGTDGQMSNCPLMGAPALCHMSPLEHAFTLQNMFAAVPFGGIFAIFISTLLALSITYLVAPFFWIRPRLFAEPLIRPPEQPYQYRHTLQEAFARGILHSKAF